MITAFLMGCLIMVIMLACIVGAIVLVAVFLSISFELAARAVDRVMDMLGF